MVKTLNEGNLLKKNKWLQLTPFIRSLNSQISKDKMGGGA